MLTRVIIKNFKSFKEETVIDLAKTNYTLLPQNVADNSVLKECIFVGGNASGKSTVIQAIKLLMDLLFSEKDVNYSLFSCLFSEDKSYSLSYEFLIDEHKISYEFEADTRKISIFEKLYVDEEPMMERMGLSAKSYIASRNGTIYDETDISNSSLFLRTLYFNTRFSTNQVLQKWMEYLKKTVYINMFDKKLQTYDSSKFDIYTYLKTNGTKTINSFLEEYNFRQTVEYSSNNNAFFFKNKVHNVLIPFEKESSGNKAILYILPVILDSESTNRILLIDNFSGFFHNSLESLLVRYFMKTAKYSQLIFTSHSTNLLSNSILRPDQEYAVEFIPATGSQVHRFSKQQPRIALNIEKMYLSGIFGGLSDYREL